MRVFLDANILFSVAWREGSGINALWGRKDIILVTSSYALQEAERNILAKKPAAAGRLAALAGKVEICSTVVPLTEEHGLPKKDIPILEAAIGCGCSVLLTGDVTHFGHLMETKIGGTQILTVSLFLARLGKA